MPNGIIGPTNEAVALHLIRSGQWREAVFLVREESGVNLSQAEAAIERLALVHGVHRFSRTFFVSLLASLGLSLLGVAAILDWIR